MALTRVWVPSPNNSARSGSIRLLVLHTMEGFTGPNGAYDCARYFQGNVGASSHVCVDNNRGKAWECVKRDRSSWTQCNYNSAALSIEQSGYASWTRDYWLTNRANELRNTADWLAEESARYGIPLTVLSAAQAQGSGRGVCQHRDLGSAGCGHSDCGSNYPIDQVIAWAKGGSGGTTPPVPGPDGGNVATSVAYDPDGHPHYVCVDTAGVLWYLPPGWANWGRVAADQKGALSGAGIAISPGWWVELTYTNGSGQPCKYGKKWMEGSWVWSALGSGIKAR